MKTRKLSEFSDFHGIDKDQEESLFTYGLLVRQRDEKTVECIYGIEQDQNSVYFKFHAGFIDPLEIFNEIWFRKAQFLDFCGQTEKEFLASDPASIIFSMKLYYGYEDLFGTEYNDGFLVVNE